MNRDKLIACIDAELLRQGFSLAMTPDTATRLASGIADRILEDFDELRAYDALRDHRLLEAIKKLFAQEFIIMMTTPIPFKYE